jgi:hypothetical protein
MGAAVYKIRKIMRSVSSLLVCLLLLSFMPGCSPEPEKQTGSGFQIAFMPDIHFHDVYADFRDGSFKGLANSNSGEHATIRTLSSALRSTRLFNESYFALLAALDDVAKRRVKYVALPGDFSDNGQPVNMRGLVEILDYYAERYGIEFLAAPGNHDPVRPYDKPAGVFDYLGEGGYEQRILSKGVKECRDYQGDWASIDAGYPLATICSEEVMQQGYKGIMEQLADHGFYPKADYLYWETPYSDYDSGNYDIDTAVEQADYGNRQYEICLQGTGGKYKGEGYSNCFQVPDSSYLVEPVAGIWLLAIDANVYIPVEDVVNSANSIDPDNYRGSGNAGYNRMFSHKTHVMEWIKQVVARASAKGKRLIAFSHFPAIEFYDDQSDVIKSMFGEENFQLVRRPEEVVAQALAAAGLKIHVAGHMHINDTGVRRYSDGSYLVNIQAPSLAAYIPAYKLMSVKADNKIEVETVVLDSVPRFNELFEHYLEEYEALQDSAPDQLWDKSILDSKSYREFTARHLEALTRQRFLPVEWPRDIREILFTINGSELLVLLQLPADMPLRQLQDGECGLSQLKETAEWQAAENSAKKLVESAGLKLADFGQWDGFDLAVDFYRLRNADQLALGDIREDRLAQYALLSDLVTMLGPADDKAKLSARQVLDPGGCRNTREVSVYLSAILKVFQAFQHGEPSEHFVLDLESGVITAADYRSTAED